MHANTAEIADALKKRTRTFSLRVIRLFRSLPKTEEARIIGKQLLRSGTSVGANYRACCRARSPKEFISKMGIVIEETDESLFWLDLLCAAEIFSEARLRDITDEAEQLLRIFVRSADTSRKRYVRRKIIKTQKSKI